MCINWNISTYLHLIVLPRYCYCMEQRVPLPLVITKSFWNSIGPWYAAARLRIMLSSNNIIHVDQEFILPVNLNPLPTNTII